MSTEISGEIFYSKFWAGLLALFLSGAFFLSTFFQWPHVLLMGHCEEQLKILGTTSITKNRYDTYEPLNLQKVI